MNVFDFAMKMEEDGKAYYENLVIQTALPGLKTIFGGLAEDEQKHYEIFQKLKEDSTVPVMTESSAMAAAKNIFEGLPTGKIALKGIEDNLAAYDHAMQMESESFKFYERAAREESDPEIKNLLMRIAVEERKHFNILENVYNFINAPNQSLDWVEFSNLSEYRQFGRDTDI